MSVIEIAPTTDFRTADGLREVLLRLHRDPTLWRTAPIAAALLEHCREKYAALARKHGQSPDDAMRVAFELLRADGTRWAADPWGALTRGVRVALLTSQFEDALMCGRNQASHLITTSSPRWVARFGEHDHLEHYVEGFVADVEAAAGEPQWDAFTVVEGIVDSAVEVLTACGWPSATAGHAVGLIASRLIASYGDGAEPELARTRAHEYLRHDIDSPRLLGLDRRPWLALLTAVLGSPSPHWHGTAVGHGMFLRLASGASRDDLLADGRLVTTLCAAAPTSVTRQDDGMREVRHA